MDFTPEREGVVKDDKTGRPNHYSDYCVEMRTKNVSSSSFLGKINLCARTAHVATV